MLAEEIMHIIFASGGMIQDISDWPSIEKAIHCRGGRSGEPKICLSVCERTMTYVIMQRLLVAHAELD